MVSKNRRRAAQRRKSAAMAAQSRSPAKRLPRGENLARNNSIVQNFAAWRPPQPQQALWAAFALAVLSTVSFFPAISGGFIWDDRIWADSHVLRDWAGLWEIWTAPGSIKNEAHYWPVLYSTFWLEYQLWGKSPLGYHCVNLALHAMFTLLLWRLLLRLGIAGAFVIAAIFAVHPTHTEAVAWIIGRKDILAGVFYIAATFAYLRYQTARAATPQSAHYGHYALAFACYVLALLSKSIAITWPAAMLLLNYWQQARITKTDALRVVPFLLVGAILAAHDVYLTHQTETIVSSYTPLHRLIIASHALWFYLGKLFYPIDLAVIYYRWEVDITALRGWLYVIAAAAVFAVLWSVRRRFGRGPLVAALFFALTLSPTLGFLNYGFMRFSYVADRFQYLASVGVITFAVAAALQFFARRRNTTAQTAFAVVVVITLATLTWRQAGIYQNEEAFFRHIVRHNSSAMSAHYNLGNAYRAQQRHSDALDAYLISLKKRPNFVNLHNNLGLTYRELGNAAAAEQHYRFGLELAPRNMHLLLNLAALRVDQQRYAAARALYQSVAAAHPDSAAARTGLRYVDAQENAQPAAPTTTPTTQQ